MDDLAINERIEEFLLHEGLDPDELMHFGVKGMKWGTRKGGGSSRPSQADIYNARAKLGKNQIKQKQLAGIAKESRASNFAKGKTEKLKSQAKEISKVADKAANKKEMAARALAGASIIAGLASVAIPLATMNASSSKAAAAAKVSDILLAGAGATLVGALVTGHVADKQESEFHRTN